MTLLTTPRRSLSLAGPATPLVVEDEATLQQAIAKRSGASASTPPPPAPATEESAASGSSGGAMVGADAEMLRTAVGAAVDETAAALKKQVRRADGDRAEIG